MRLVRSSVVAAVLVLVLPPSVCAADPGVREGTGTEAALAESLFRDGRALLEAGRVDEACPKLEASERLEPRLTTLLNVAACHELAGRDATAWTEFLEAARRARETSAAEGAVLERTARSRAIALEPRLHRVQLRASPGSSLDGVDVRFDHRPVPLVALASPFPVDPGEHTVECTRPGYAPVTVRVRIERGPGTSIVSIPDLVPLAAARQPSATGPGPALFASAGVAVVGLAVGAYFGLDAMDAKADRDRLCSERGCPPDGIREQERGKTAATASTVAFAVGLIAVGTAVYFVVRGTGRTRPSSAGWFANVAHRGITFP